MIKPETNNFVFFDKIYCINLDRRWDRWETVCEQFDQVGITDMVERVPGTEISIFEDSKRNACYGNHLSHAKCIELAEQSNAKNVLILEDDVLFLNKANAILGNSIEQLPKNWDMLYLGVNTEEVAWHVYPNLARLTFAFSTHAYAINMQLPSVYDDLWKINVDKDTIHNDVIYNQKIIPYYNCYSCVPIIAIQSPSYSDIEERTVDYNWMVDRFNSHLRMPDDGYFYYTKSRTG